MPVSQDLGVVTPPLDTVAIQAVAEHHMAAQRESQQMWACVSALAKRVEELERTAAITAVSGR